MPPDPARRPIANADGTTDLALDAVDDDRATGPDEAWEDEDDGDDGEPDSGPAAPPAPRARGAVDLLRVQICVLGAVVVIGLTRGVTMWFGILIGVLGVVLVLKRHQDQEVLEALRWVLGIIGGFIVLVGIATALVRLPSTVQPATGWDLTHLAASAFGGLLISWSGIGIAERPARPRSPTGIRDSTRIKRG